MSSITSKISRNKHLEIKLHAQGLILAGFDKYLQCIEKALLAKNIFTKEELEGFRREAMQEILEAKRKPEIIQP